MSLAIQSSNLFISRRDEDFAASPLPAGLTNVGHGHFGDPGDGIDFGAFTHGPPVIYDEPAKPLPPAAPPPKDPEPNPLVGQPPPEPAPGPSKFPSIPNPHPTIEKTPGGVIIGIGGTF